MSNDLLMLLLGIGIMLQLWGIDKKLGKISKVVGED